MTDGTMTPLELGEELYLRLTIFDEDGAQVYDWLNTDATLTLDSPDKGDGTAQTRTVMKYRPADVSDDGVSYDGEGIIFNKPTTWTAENMYVGVWDVSITVFSPLTNARKVIYAKLPVFAPHGGGLNTDA